MNIRKTCSMILDIILLSAVAILVWHVVMPEKLCWLKPWQYFTLLIISAALVSDQVFKKNKP